MADQTQGVGTGGIIAIILVTAIIAIAGYSYSIDGDLNPFNNNIIAEADVGGTELSITDEGNGSIDFKVDN